MKGSQGGNRRADISRSVFTGFRVFGWVAECNYYRKLIREHHGDKGLDMANDWAGITKTNTPISDLDKLLDVRNRLKCLFVREGDKSK